MPYMIHCYFCNSIVVLLLDFGSCSNTDDVKSVNHVLTKLMLQVMCHKKKNILLRFEHDCEQLYVLKAVFSISMGHSDFYSVGLWPR